MPFTLRSERNKKDLVYYFSKFGKTVKKIFTKRDLELAVDSEHSLFSYGFVYANDPASPEMEKADPVFPAGAIIVREKMKTEDSETPETVIAMVKREKGFSKKTDDWEFFVFDGEYFKVNTRETRGSCAECHSNARQTDWVFRGYLK
jgi:predicted metal-binding protein